MLAGVSEPKPELDQVMGFGDVTALSINLAICTSCTDPGTALRWLDYHFSEEGSLLSQYGLEGGGLAFDKNGKACYSNLISNNPDGLSTDNALNQYAININMYAKNCESLKAAYSDIQRSALGPGPENIRSKESWWAIQTLTAPGMNSSPPWSPWALTRSMMPINLPVNGILDA